jgi:hypothetical protein
MDDLFNFDNDDNDSVDIEPNREDDFDLETGRFRGDDGEFDPGSPPPDFDEDSNRFRAKNGEFKEQADDLYDEPEEVRLDSLEPDG